MLRRTTALSGVLARPEARGETPRVSTQPDAAADAARAAGAAAAQAAMAAAKVARAMSDQAAAARVRAAAHRAVDAANRTTAGTMASAAEASAAADAVAATVPSSDASADAQALRAHAGEARSALVSAVMHAGQSLYDALRAVRGDLTAFPQPDQDGVVAIDDAMAAVADCAAAWGAHVGQDHPQPAPGIVEQAVRRVERALDTARRVAARELTRGIPETQALARRTIDDINRAQTSVRGIAAAAGAGLGAGLIVGGALLLLLLLNKH